MKRDSRSVFPDVDWHPGAPAARTCKGSVGRTCAVHSRLPPTVSILPPYRHQFRWRLVRLPCYPIDMQVMARSLSLLLLAVALMLPTVVRASVRADVLIVTPAAFVQSAIPHQARRIAMRCHRCFGKACDASAVTCGAYCGTASALTPLVIVLASVSRHAAEPSAFTAARDHRGPPDPHPPRPIAIG